ncbi:MAG: alpha-amylase family glycosyl hydrolase, partial [Pseudomonadota bacterium]
MNFKKKNLSEHIVQVWALSGALLFFSIFHNLSWANDGMAVQGSKPLKRCRVLFEQPLVKTALDTPVVFTDTGALKVRWHKNPLEQYGPTVTPEGTKFSIWLPNAKEVSVITDANNWQTPIKLTKNADGVWEGFSPEAKQGSQYKYRIVDAQGNIQFRVDPEAPYINRDQSGKNWNGVVWDHSSYKWSDQAFRPDSKMRVLELHPGTVIPGSPYANYREIADYIINHYGDTINFVSLMPVTQHNLAESWGYQVGGVFAIDFRHGTPDDFKYLVNKLHINGKGVILDMVYGHETKDWDTGLAMMDGTEIYFKEGRMGYHPVWGTRLYQYESEGVSNFLLSNLIYWIREYHIDGARIDAVDSMMQLDFYRAQGEWDANSDGGNINYGAR